MANRLTRGRASSCSPNPNRRKFTPFENGMKAGERKRGAVGGGGGRRCRPVPPHPQPTQEDLPVKQRAGVRQTSLESTPSLPTLTTRCGYPKNVYPLRHKLWKPHLFPGIPVPLPLRTRLPSPRPSPVSAGRGPFAFELPALFAAFAGARRSWEPSYSLGVCTQVPEQ